LKTVSKPPRATTNNQQRSISFANSGGVQYFYDAQNKRVWQATCLPGSCTPGSTWILYTSQINLFGADGKQLASYSPIPAWNNTSYNQVAITFGPVAVRSYFGGRLVAQQSGVNTYQPVIQDRLGSVGKYYPYGEERNSPQLPNDQVKFATYTRDSATGNDYADQRYYTSVLGRFMTPDPYVASVGPRDPGSWNRYSYTRGDPVNRYDPSGMDDCGPEDDSSDCNQIPNAFILVSGPPPNPGAEKGAKSSPPTTAQYLFTMDVLALKADARNLAGDLLTGDLPENCAKDIVALGITPEQWANALNNVSIQFGPGSQVPLASTLPVGSTEWQIALNRSLVVGGEFSDPQSLTTAWSSVNAGLVWINPMLVNIGNVLGATALIAHETLHNLGLLDSTIQKDLGLAVTSNDTTNITKKLEDDCLPGISGPSVLP
jgi:RHS repeat-associated protein